MGLKSKFEIQQSFGEYSPKIRLNGCDVTDSDTNEPVIKNGIFIKPTGLMRRTLLRITSPERYLNTLYGPDILIGMQVVRPFFEATWQTNGLYSMDLMAQKATPGREVTSPPPFPGYVEMCGKCLLQEACQRESNDKAARRALPRIGSILEDMQPALQSSAVKPIE
jgi:hypothetical protein